MKSKQKLKTLNTEKEHFPFHGKATLKTILDQRIREKWKENSLMVQFWNSGMNNLTRMAAVEKRCGEKIHVPCTHCVTWNKQTKKILPRFMLLVMWRHCDLRSFTWHCSGNAAANIHAAPFRSILPFKSKERAEATLPSSGNKLLQLQYCSWLRSKLCDPMSQPRSAAVFQNEATEQY